jgi:hypothetical protein
MPASHRLTIIARTNAISRALSKKLHIYRPLSPANAIELAGFVIPDQMT